MFRLLPRRRAEDDAGFTMIELVVAITVLTGILVAVADSALVSMRAVALGRQRTSANSLATQALEEVRALPYATLAKGLDDTDLAATPLDASITRVGSVYSFKGETLPHGNIVASGTTEPPLVPHRSNTTMSGVTYTVATYPTLVAASPGVVRVTVVVSWSANGTPGAVHSVTDSTLVASPTGCASGANHPYVAPCQAFLYASGGSSGASVTVTGTIGALTVTGASITLANLVSNLQAEQVTADNGTVNATGGSLAVSGLPTISIGGASTTVHSDDDPASTASAAAQSTLATQGSTTAARSDGEGGAISLSIGAGDTGSGQAAAAANPTTAPCNRLDGTSETDAMPCGFASVRAGGTATMSATTPGITATFPLLQVGAPGTNSLVSVARDSSADATLCSGTSGDGCATAGATRTIGAATFGGLPSSMSPAASWNGSLVQVSKFTDTVRAEAGIGAGRPSVTIANAPVVSWWNGTGYSTTTITNSTAAQHLTVAPVTAVDPSTGYRAVMTADLSLGGVTTTDPAGCGTSTCTRASASAVVSAPIVGSITYVVDDGHGNVVAQFTLAIDLGTDRVDTSYQAAPSSAP